MSGLAWTIDDDPGWWTKHIATLGLFTLMASEFPDEGEGPTFAWSIDFDYARFPDLDSGDVIVSGNAESIDEAKQSAIAWMILLGDHAGIARDELIAAVTA